MKVQTPGLRPTALPKSLHTVKGVKTWTLSFIWLCASICACSVFVFFPVEPVLNVFVYVWVSLCLLQFGLVDQLAWLLTANCFEICGCTLVTGPLFICWCCFHFTNILLIDAFDWFVVFVCELICKIKWTDLHHLISLRWAALFQNSPSLLIIICEMQCCMYMYHALLYLYSWLGTFSCRSQCVCVSLYPPPPSVFMGNLQLNESWSVNTSWDLKQRPGLNAISRCECECLSRVGKWNTGAVWQRRREKKT